MQPFAFIRVIRGRAHSLTLARKGLFCLLAVLLSLLPLLLFEGICVLAGWGKPQPGLDPFVGFADIEPLFVKEETGEKYVTSENRLSLFARDEFPVIKGQKTRRIFCLGGSTVQGEPYSIQTAFPAWLEISLNVADPEHDWEVINCGGLSYASYRLVNILEEVLDYQPDLIILCSGHNEFLEDRTYPELKSIPQWSQGPVSWLAKRRTTVLLSRLMPQRNVSGGVEGKTTLPAETEAMLDFHNGTAAYHWDPEWHAGVVNHYRYNIHRMISMTREAGVPVIVMKPSSNLAHNPPFKSEHRQDLTEHELSEWQQELDRARELYARDLGQAIEHLQRACEIDPQYSLAWYELGQALAVADRTAEAREVLVKARDLDICPLRMTGDLERGLEEVVAQTGVPYLDMHRLFEERVPTGILGDQWLVDHVHPNFAGHQLVGTTLLPMIAELGLVHPESDWEAAAKLAFQQHFESLDRTYFHKGNRKLESLRGWAAGRADGPPVETKYPHRVRPEDVRIEHKSARE